MSSPASNTSILKVALAAGAVGIGGLAIYRLFFSSRPTTEVNTRGNFSPVSTGASSPIINPSGSGNFQIATTPTYSPLVSGGSTVQTISYNVDTQAASTNVKNLNTNLRLGMALTATGITAVAWLVIRYINYNNRVAMDGNLATSLHRESAFGSLERIKKLLNKQEGFDIVSTLFYPPCDINAKTKYNLTPLMYAVLLRREDVAMYLIDQGSELDTVSAQLDSVFKMTVTSVLSEAVKKMVKQAPGLLARDPEAISALLSIELDQINDIEYIKKRAQHYGIQIGELPMLMTTTPIRSEIEQIASFLIQNGASLGKDPNEVLVQCIKKDLPNLLETVLEAKPVFNVQLEKHGMKTPLMVAIENKKFACANTILRQTSCDVNQRDAEDNTALHILINVLISDDLRAAEEEQVLDIAKCILAKSTASLQYKNKQSQTPASLVDLIAKSGTTIEQLKMIIHSTR